jgi:hypothetical protein
MTAAPERKTAARIPADPAGDGRTVAASGGGLSVDKVRG